MSTINAAAAVHPQQPAHPARDRSIFTQKTAVPLTWTGQAELFSLPEVYVKPHRGPAFEDSKRSAQLKQPLVLSAPKKRDSSIMFHPLLPYQLQLYFNDRQAVHIELQFKTEPGQGRKSVVVKRKISSGNLEADLLSMRYMQYYLYIQKERFPPESWQTVRIDLSTKND